MNVLKPAIAAVGLCAMTIPGIALSDTAAERDKRRAGYMVGFVCNMYIQGQVGHMKWLKNGNGEWVIPQHSDSFTWGVENDEYCIEFNGGSEHCIQFPNKTIDNEQAEFEKWMKKDCLFN